MFNLEEDKWLVVVQAEISTARGRTLSKSPRELSMQLLVDMFCLTHALIVIQDFAYMNMDFILSQRQTHMDTL